MAQNEQHKKPLMSEEKKQVLMESMTRHRQKLETDPEYRAHWEKTKAHFERIALLNDSEED